MEEMIEADLHAAIATETCVLTRRQIDIVRLYAKGLNGTEVGAALWLSPKTVKAHLATARHINQAHTTCHLVALAIRAGVI